ncbi:histidine kinase [Nitratireductor aquimarinus]|uniref:Histidine kinase n=1 Tax=Nitratireductor aquimarinus TaxID=889300 RepID=A0ABU4AHK1_9HYPH|nr:MULTISPECIES: histidine kinase [Nitratireductor]MCA1304411.1 histidine kinase [Nitratireductor aquimarinus]MDJ1463050.1 histidine kinase [Nitratireductor sp. GZWM139]MDV2968210.1 histidine kinase [Nitratireductor aquimarinus]MDV6225727.1 histidine kinase [Nitratireductor aquimarinus]
MPTLFRLLVIVAILVGLVYGAMIALATFVEPETGEMSVRVPVDRLNPTQ